jgi:hypothetical protein
LESQRPRYQTTWRKKKRKPRTYLNLRQAGVVLLDVDLIVDKQLVERLPMALEDDVHHRASSRFHVDPISHYTPLIPSTDMHRT